jgi:hypothetical protein
MLNDPTPMIAVFSAYYASPTVAEEGCALSAYRVAVVLPIQERVPSLLTARS